MTKNELLDIAAKARENAHSPYSKFKVGAALLCDDGKVYTGCNVENASYGATICAERVAFGNAVCDGERKFTAIAIVGGYEGDINTPCYPCGMCRQVMSEFCSGEFEIVLKSGGDTVTCKLNDVLPFAFLLNEKESK